MVSGLDIPAGMKNPTSGDFSVMLNSVVAAQKGLIYFQRMEVQTEGTSSYSHLSGEPSYAWKYYP